MKQMPGKVLGREIIMAELRVGQVLKGFCGGFFGRDSYGAKRIEAIGHDWIVVREGDNPNFACTENGSAIGPELEDYVLC